jgi:hypothetical protein
MRTLLRVTLAVTVVCSATASCDKFKATTDRAFKTLSLKHAGDPCPPAVDGRASGTETPDAAVACFQKAVDQKKSDLLLRVTCHGKTTSTCKHSDATAKEADKAVADLSKLSWGRVVGKWNEGEKTMVYAIDNMGDASKRMSSVSLCRIAEGDKWAICEVGEVPRETVKKKVKDD